MLKENLLGSVNMVMDHSLSSVDEMRNAFQKADYQGENPFATPRSAGFPLDPLSENSHMFAEKRQASERPN
jgi:hypothetical protein